MAKGRVLEDLDALFDDEFVDQQGSSSGKTASVRNRLANLFVEDEVVTPELRYVSEQKPSETRNDHPNPRVVYSASVSASMVSNATTMPRGTLGLAILRSSTGSQITDELMLYTATKKVELRHRLSGTFSLSFTTDQRAVFHDSSHNQWLISFLNTNSLVLFVVTVVRCVDRHRPKDRTLSEVIRGGGQGASIGDSLLFDVTLYTENPDGCIVEHKKEVGVKMKLTKKIVEKPSWKQVLVGMRQGSTIVISQPGFLGCVSVRRIKLAGEKSSEERESSPITSHPAEKNSGEKMANTDEVRKEKGEGNVESAVHERMSRIGALPLPALSDASTKHNAVPDDNDPKDSLTNGIEEPNSNQNPEVERQRAESETKPAPHPQPRQRVTVHERIPPSGLSLERFYETFLLELDRLHNRMEMSSARILRNELETVKQEVRALRDEVSENISRLSTKLDEINSAVVTLTEKQSTGVQLPDPQSTRQSVLERAMDRFAGEGSIELADARNILNEVITEQQSVHE